MAIYNGEQSSKAAHHSVQNCTSCLTVLLAMQEAPPGQRRRYYIASRLDKAFCSFFEHQFIFPTSISPESRPPCCFPLEPRGHPITILYGKRGGSTIRRRTLFTSRKGFSRGYSERECIHVRLRRDVL